MESKELRQDLHEKNCPENPAISALMCVYNTPEEWLRKAIESILRQSFRDFEFIIVLDNPTDGSEQIVKSYAETDRRIVVIRNDNNMGLTRSLNRGLAAARGRYIARMDSDDVSMPDRFEKQLRFMETHPDAAVVGSRVFTSNHGAPVQYECADDQQVLRIRLLFHNVGVPHPTAMIRRSMLRQHNVKYDERILKSQDYKLWVDLIPYGKIIMMPDVLLMYRVHDNQISAGVSSQKGYAQRVALEQAGKLVGQMTEQEKQVHCQLTDSYDADNGKRADKDYLQRLLSSNKQKNIYDQSKLKRELEFIWCQKAWRRAVIDHKFDYFLDVKTLRMLKPSVFRYIIQNKKTKKEYEAAALKKQQEYLKENNK